MADSAAAAAARFRLRAPESVRATSHSHRQFRSRVQSVYNNHGCWLGRLLIAQRGASEFLAIDQEAAEPEKSDAKPIEREAHRDRAVNATRLRPSQRTRSFGADTAIQSPIQCAKQVGVYLRATIEGGDFSSNRQKRGKRDL